MSQAKYSLVAVVLSIVLIVYAGTFHFNRWGAYKAESTFGWDCGSYYQYLPSLFIYDDLRTQHLTDSVKDEYDFQPGTTPNTRPDKPSVIVYSSGMALVYSPAFFVAHCIAGPLGYPEDGFSIPYQVSVGIWCLCIAIIGLLYFRKLLLYYFSDKAVAITLFLIAIGTNYLNYASTDANAPHVILFMLYVLFLLSIRKFYINPNIKSSISIGIIYGLLVLIRPSEMVAALLPLLWGLDSLKLKAIKQHFSFLLKHIKYILIVIACAVAVGSIQIFYWYYVIGKPIYYSYQFSFFWDGRFIYDFLFSWGHGWLMYNPLVGFGIIGLFIYIAKGKQKVAILAFLLINFYVISAWEIWWYSGIPGRALVQSYAVLAFPFAIFVETVLQKRVLKWVLGLLSVIFLYFNIWLFHNSHLPPGLFDAVGMSGAYYRSVVGRWDVPDQTRKLKDTDELFRGTPKNFQLLFENDFEQDSLEHNPKGGINSTNGIYFDGNRTHSQIYSVNYGSQDLNADWIRASIDASAISQEWVHWRMVQLTVTFKDNEKRIVKVRMMRINRFANTIEPHRVFLDVEIPEEPFHHIEVHFWNPGSNHILLLDNLKVESFQE